MNWLTRMYVGMRAAGSALRMSLVGDKGVHVVPDGARVVLASGRKGVPEPVFDVLALDAATAAKSVGARVVTVTQDHPVFRLAVFEPARPEDMLRVADAVKASVVRSLVTLGYPAEAEGVWGGSDAA